MAPRFRGSSRFASAASTRPVVFVPASFSSSKMDEEARSPRTGGAAVVVGFFRRNSSVKIFFGASALGSGFFFLPNQKSVRR